MGKNKPKTAFERWNRFLGPLNIGRVPGLRSEYLFSLAAEPEDFSAPRETTILARDGLAPLLWFFRKRGRPAAFQGKILVHEQFGAFVPSAWRAQVELYRVEGIDPSDAKEILFYGHISPRHASITHLDETFFSVEEKFPRWREKKIYFFGPASGHHGNNATIRFHTEFFLEMGRRLPRDVEVLDWKQINERDSFRGCAIVSLNDRFLCADNHVTHNLLAKEAHLLLPEGSGAVTRRVTISPQHGLAISALRAGSLWEKSPGLLFRAQEAEEFYSQLGQGVELSESEEEEQFAWPLWFESWCRSLEAGGAHA